MNFEKVPGTNFKRKSREKQKKRSSNESELLLSLFGESVK
jgi:hypothetical protein